MSATVDPDGAVFDLQAIEAPDSDDVDPLDVLVYTPTPLVQVGLRGVLQTTEGVRLVAETTTLDHAQKLCTNLQPDVALLDLTLAPEVPISLDQLGSLRRSLAPARLLVLVDPHAPADLGRVLARRVAGVLRRNAQPAEIALAVHQVGRGNAVFGLAQPALPQRPTRRRSAGQRVTPREIEVLKLLARGFGTQAIGTELHITTSTVKFHLRQLTDKLGTGSRASLVYRAVQQGLLPLTLRAVEATKPIMATPSASRQEQRVNTLIPAVSS